MAGCAAGAAGASASGSGISGGSGCGAGALGAVTGELAAGLPPMTDTVQFASMVSGIAAAVAGQDAQGVAIAASTGANAAENNRMLHQNEYDFARKNAILVAKKLGISQDEAEGRIVRETQRNADAQTAQTDGTKHDYEVIAILGLNNLAGNVAKTDPAAYNNPMLNRDLIAANSNAYAKSLSFSGYGQTYGQLVTKNIKDNPVSTGIAGVAMTATGAVVAGPAAVVARALAGGIGAGFNVGFQQFGSQPVDWLDVGIAGTTGFITGGASNWQQGLSAASLINVGGSLTGSAIKGENPNAGMGGAVLGTVVGYPVGKLIETPMDKVFNQWYRPDWVSTGALGILKPNPPSVVPGAAAGVGSSFIQEVTGSAFQDMLNKKQGQ